MKIAYLEIVDKKQSKNDYKYLSFLFILNYILMSLIEDLVWIDQNIDNKENIFFIKK